MFSESSVEMLFDCPGVFSCPRNGLSLLQGPIVPCTHAMLAKWIPPNERSRMGAFVYAGKPRNQSSCKVDALVLRLNGSSIRLLFHWTQDLWTIIPCTFKQWNVLKLNFRLVTVYWQDDKQVFLIVRFVFFSQFRSSIWNSHLDATEWSSIQARFRWRLAFRLLRLRYDRSRLVFVLPLLRQRGPGSRP